MPQYRIKTDVVVQGKKDTLKGLALNRSGPQLRNDG